MPATAPGRPARRSTRSATSPSRSRTGSPRSASSAPVLAGLPARRHPRQGLRPGAPRPAPRRPSSPIDAKGKEFAGHEVHASRWRPRTAPAAALCVYVCPACKDEQGTEDRAQGHQHGRPARRCASAEAANFDFFLALPDPDPKPINRATVKGSQFCRRCSSSPAPARGCGETPYVKLLTQLFGDRMLIANATGCSSIYGGNLPTTPYTPAGRRPRAGLVELALRGQRRVRLRHAPDRRQVRRHARASCSTQLLDGQVGAGRRRSTQRGRPSSERGGVEAAARARRRAQGAPGRARRTPDASALLTVADYLVRSRSGSSAATAGPTTSATAGWTTCWPPAATSTCWCSTPRSTPTPAARSSKSTPHGRRGQVRRRRQADMKKDLGMIAMTYGNIYVAQVALGANTTPDRARPSRRPRPTTARR